MPDLELNSVIFDEKDIEEWLYENPGAVRMRQWIGRQYALPNGIADLIGIDLHGYAVVVEVKNGPIKKAALTQISRYRRDVDHILSNYAAYPQPGGASDILACVVGTDIDEETLIEARSLWIKVVLFRPIFSLDVSFVEPSVNHPSETYSQIAERPEWRIFGPTYAETDGRDEGYKAVKEFRAKRLLEVRAWQRGE